MPYSSVDGVSHLNTFICKECGFELPHSHMSNVKGYCLNCEKEIVVNLEVKKSSIIFRPGSTSVDEGYCDLPF